MKMHSVSCLALAAFATCASGQQSHRVEIMARSGSGLSNIGTNLSINDAGTVAFTANDGSGNRIWVASTPGALNGISFAGSASRNYANTAINNAAIPQVSTREAVSQTTVSYLVRKWTADGSQMWTVICSSLAGSGFPACFDSASFTDINDSGLVAFAALQIGSTRSAVYVGQSRPATPLVTYNHNPNPILLRPHLSNIGTVVVRDDVGQIVLLGPSPGPGVVIAGSPAYSDTGNRPGIAPDGSAIGFTATSAGVPGVFISVPVSGGRAIHRIAGGPGDEPTAFPDGQRVAVLRSVEVRQVGSPPMPVTVQILRAAFVGEVGAVSKVYLREVELAESGGLTEIARRTNVIASTDAPLSAGLPAPTSFVLYDPLNAAGDVAFHANLADGTSAVVRASNTIKRIDPLYRSDAPRERSNAILHRTEGYLSRLTGDDARTVVRRGQLVDIDVEVYQPFDPATLRLAASAKHGFDGVDTSISIPLHDAVPPTDQWGCRIVRWRDQNPATRVAEMQINIPPNAPVGEYRFTIAVQNTSGVELTKRDFPLGVIVLFNPWSSADAVYLSNEAERVEYTLNEHAVIWRGTARSHAPMGWSVSQFSKDVLLGTVELLDGLNASGRSSPATVSRWLSAKVNANEGGMLTGRWDGQYSDGNNPSHWISSQEVFTAYRTAGPVRYGQCWVFAGILTSSCRTLGIPARPITNFESAHDSTMPPDGVIDECEFYDTAAGRWRMSGESVWNFHVWAEAWMRRSDLVGADGWQAVDATPQERSGGVHQMGPTPVSAILARVPAPFDGAFVLSAVDADRQHSVQNGGTCVPDRPRDTTWVGRRIKTKAVGSNAAVDITASYKTPETTRDPRAAEELEIAAPDDSPLGVTINGVITIRNFDAQARDYTCYTHVRAIAQNGNELGLVTAPTTDPITLAANAEMVLPADVPWATLQPWMNATDVVEYVVVLTRLNDEERWFKRRLVRVRGLPIQIVLNPAHRVDPGGAVLATILYSNPLTTPIENAVLRLGGDAGLLIGGTTSSEDVPLGTIAPGANASLQRSLVGALTGQRMFLARMLGDGVVPGDEFASILVGYCTADVDDGTGTGTPDGGVTIEDLLYYLVVFDSGDIAADVDDGTGTGTPDGGVTIDDLLYYLARFETGC